MSEVIKSKETEPKNNTAEKKKEVELKKTQMEKFHEIEPVKLPFLVPLRSGQNQAL